MSNNFTKCIEFTLPWEVGKDKNGNLREDGGYTNLGPDPGGETKWGISKRANPEVDIKNLTLEDAIKIYKNKYYDIYTSYPPIGPDQKRLNLDDLELSIAVVLFDSGVNCGTWSAYKWYLNALSTADPAKSLLEQRKMRYVNNPLYRLYGKGWLNRLNDLQKYSAVLAAETA